MFLFCAFILFKQNKFVEFFQGKQKVLITSDQIVYLLRLIVDFKKTTTTIMWKICEKKTWNMPSSCDLPVLFGLKIGFYWPKNWFSDQKSMILSTNSIKISKYLVKNVFYLHFLQIRKRSINEIHHAPDRWVSIPKRIWSIFTHDFFSYTYFQSSSVFLFDFNFNNPKTSRNSSYLIPIE